MKQDTRREGIRNLRKRERTLFSERILIDGRVMARTVDISEDGLYVHTGRSFVPGQIVEVEVPLPEGALKGKARVQYNQEGIGMGLKFAELGTGQKEKIARLIERLHGGCRARETERTVGRRIGILIVGEESAFQRIYRSKLILEGFSVISTGSGHEGMEILRKGTFDIRLIILTLYRDKRKAFALLSTLKQSPEHGDIPVVMLSDLCSAEIMHESVKKGAVECLTRVNASPVMVAEKVKAILRNARREARKMNCWEFRGCGRHPGGKNVEQSGLCPAATVENLNGIHGGVNGGRSCWAVAGAEHAGAAWNAIAEKHTKCVSCDFYGKVRQEEGEDYLDTMVLLHRMSLKREESESKRILRQERRGQRRFKKRCEVEFSANDTTHRGISSNFSLGGLFIRTDHPFAPGSVLDMVIYYGDGTTSKLKGRVRRALKTPTGKVLGTPVTPLTNGMGVEFIDKDAGYLHFIRSLLFVRRESAEEARVFPTA